jgi:anaerobic dimethyl sulfoxide reductase subunit B
MSEQCAISFRKERCVQCHACELACKSWRNVEPGVKWRRVDNIWDGSYPEVRSYSVSVACVHCAKPACVEACSAGAIEKRVQDGTVVVDKEKCTGCRVCFDACPYGAPQFGADTKMQKCDLCIGEKDLPAGIPPCVATCPTEALLFDNTTGKNRQRGP